MKISIRNELILLNLLVISLVIVTIVLPSDSLRVALGLPFLLFLPGYTLVIALFPRRQEMDAVERLALSFGMSIAIVAFIGFILNFSPWGIRSEPIVYSVASFIFITSVIAWLRRSRLPEPERFVISFQPELLAWGGSIWSKTLQVALAVSILGALGVAGYAISSPRGGEKFTEFYMLGSGGKADDYPKELTSGQAGKVVVGIINRERQGVDYYIEVSQSEVVISRLGPLKLEHDQKWEQEVSFIPAKTGLSQKVEFLLFRENGGEPYRRLYLWLDVR